MFPGICGTNSIGYILRNGTAESQGMNYHHLLQIIAKCYPNWQPTSFFILSLLFLFCIFPSPPPHSCFFFPLRHSGTHPKKLSKCHLIEYKRLIDIFHVRKDYRRHFLSEFLCKSRSNSDIKVDKSIVKLSFMPSAKEVIFCTL